MQIENDYDKDVYNGDIGMIEDVDPDDGEVAVNFDGRTVTFLFGELDTVVPAYAAMIHKKSGVRIPRRSDPHHDPALRDVTGQLDLHRRHPRQEAGRSRWPKEGSGDRGEEYFWAAARL